jgi:REP element-mobilizing transposase RayT
MARLPRFILPSQPQHVILRGNNRTEIFCGEADYRFYLDKLRLACEKDGCGIHAYVLMTNHVHLLLAPKEEQSLSKAWKYWGVIMRSFSIIATSATAHYGKGVKKPLRYRGVFTDLDALRIQSSTRRHGSVSGWAGLLKLLL